MDYESGVPNQSSTEPRSESKTAVGQKRAILQAEETSESSQKRVKLGDVGSAHSSKEVTEGSNAANPSGNSGSEALNLNVSVSSICISAVEESYKVLHTAKEAKNSVFCLDLTAEDISSSINDPFSPYKNRKHLNSSDDSECATSVGSLDDKDAMKVWQGMKQNNYLSTPYVAATSAVPKPSGRKSSNNDAVKRIELAEKEQVDRIAKVAAPCGLLNGLNPGIINHVRNRKQVHSIIDTLLKSERNESQQSGSKNGDQTETVVLGNMHNLGMNVRSVMAQRRQIGFSAPTNYLKTECTRGYGDLYMGGMRVFEKMPSQYTMASEDDRLALKLSPSVVAAWENTSHLSNEESGSLTNLDLLSVKAANVALQWLELLIHDIERRLLALRRSKKRVRTVVTKELPLLLSKEFPYNTENSYTKEGSTPYHFTKPLVNAHAARWNALFGQMETALAEEESNLERWLHQVTEMYFHCERNLYKGRLYLASPETGPTENNRLRESQNNYEGELAVRAAAASIYSTCNYLLSMTNQPSCC